MTVVHDLFTYSWRTLYHPLELNVITNMAAIASILNCFDSASIKPLAFIWFNVTFSVVVDTTGMY